MIKNIQIFYLLESILNVDSDFNEIINSMRNRDMVANIFHKLISKDIKTNLNYIKPSDKNDEIKFVNDSQVKRIIDGGVSNVFDRSNNVSKIGRSVRQILKMNDVDVSDSDIEKFVNSYKNIWDRKYKKMEGFSFVDGEDIRNWYLDENYVSGGGTLNNSCMRYKKCQEYLDIYVKNPGVCKLFIYVDSRNLLLGRALVWKTEDGKFYLDRIYTRFDNELEKMKEWFSEWIKSQSAKFTSYYNNDGMETVKLRNFKFEYYPYMDSFYYLNPETGILMRDRRSDEPQMTLQSTSGGYEISSYVYSNKHSRWIRIGEAVEINGEYYLQSDCVQCYNGSFVLKDDGIYSDYYKSYIKRGDETELEGYGLVSRRDITRAFTVFDSGKLSGEITILRSEINRNDSKFISIEYGWNTVLVSKDIVSWVIDKGEWKLIDDISKYQKMYCFSESDIPDEFLERGNSDGYYTLGKYVKDISGFSSFFPIGVFGYDTTGRRRSPWINDDNVKFLKLNKESREVGYLSKQSYTMYYYNTIYDIMIDYLKSLDGNVFDKDIKMEEINRDVKMIKNSTHFKDFSERNEIYKIVKSGNIVEFVTGKLVDFFKGFVDNLFSNSAQERMLPFLTNNFANFNYFDNGSNITFRRESNRQDALNFTKAYLKDIVYFFYLYSLSCHNRSNSETDLYRFMSENRPSQTSANRTVSNIIHYMPGHVVISSKIPDVIDGFLSDCFFKYLKTGSSGYINYSNISVAFEDFYSKLEIKQ